MARRGEHDASRGEETRTKCFATTNNDNGEGVHVERRPTIAYSISMEKGDCGFSQLQWRRFYNSSMLCQENNFSKNLILSKRIGFDSDSCANIFKNSSSDSFEISIGFWLF